MKKAKSFKELVNPTILKMKEDAERLRKENKHMQANNIERLIKILSKKNDG